MHNDLIGLIKQRYLLYFLMFILFVGCLLPIKSHAFGSGAQGPDVYAVQGMLKSLGFYSGTIDGKFGFQTVHAVKHFQRHYSLSITGAVNNKTLKAILWAYGELKIPKYISKTAPEKPPISSELAAEEMLLFKYVNQERISNNLEPLIVNVALSKVAEEKSKDMVDNRYFSHQSPTFGTPFEMMKQFSIDYTTAGENIACDLSVEAAHQALMDSPGHRENILNNHFTHIGIGIVNGGQCGKVLTQQFIGK